MNNVSFLIVISKQIKTGRLSFLYTVDSESSLSSLVSISLEYKLFAPELIIKLITFRLLRIAAGACGVVIA